jgi:hypothetical protein
MLNMQPEKFACFRGLSLAAEFENAVMLFVGALDAVR